MSQPIRWVVCKGCGCAVGFLTKTWHVAGKTLPEGAVLHVKTLAKPAVQANQRPAPCSLFQQTGAREFAALHADADPIDGPDLIRPLDG